MNGRIEKETKFQELMHEKLKTLPPIFSSFYNWMEARDKSYTTIKNYINHTVELMNFVNTYKKKNNNFYKNITDDDIEKFMTHVKEKNINGNIILVGDDIRAAKWSSLNTFFNFLVQKKYIDSNPMTYTERPKIKTEHTVTYLTQKETQSIFDRVYSEARPKQKNRDACIIGMGLGTGLRVSAIVNINVEDINFTNNTIKVIEKGRKSREINFAENLKNLLLIWLNDRTNIFGCDENDGPLFVSQKHNRLSIYAVENLLNKYTSHLDKHITPHKLRSSAAMNLHGAGVDILTIASLLGHENITTTQRYVQAYEESKKQATNILDNLI